MTARGALLAALLASAAGAGGAAPALVIYRCVAADGAVTIQNDAKCPKGTRSEKRVLERPAAPTSVVPAVAPPVPAPAAVTPLSAASPPPSPPTEPTSVAPEAVAPKPAPPIYACLTPDAQRYYADTETSTRCAPLTVVGLGGARDDTGAEACERVEDRCEAVPEPERCAAWTERRQRAEQARTFQPEAIDAARAELEAIDAATAGTVCAR